MFFIHIYLNIVYIYSVADVLLPPDASLIKHNEVDVVNKSSSHKMSSASSPADSTITENAQNKFQVPLFKKPFNVRYKENPRHSLFDSDMKDSEPDTPDHNVHRPFQRKTRGYSKTNVSFDKILNFSNENMDLSNCSFNLSNVRKNKSLENSLCGKDNTYESGNSFSADPVFQRQKASHAIRIPEVFDDIFEQSSDSSLSNTIRGTHKTNKNVRIETQGKLGNTPDNSLSKHQNTIEQPHGILTQNTNFITRRRLKRKKIIKSNSFDEDLITSESDESFSLKPAFKRHTVVQGVKKSSIFDNDLENSISTNVSITESPTLKRLPFLTSKKTHAENLSGFDSPLNESLNKSENKMSISHDIFPKKFVKVRADDSINFDDVVNNTCDGSSLSSSLTLKDKSLEKEKKNLHVDKSNASIDSSQSTLTNQTELDISNKTEELNISCSMKLSKLSEINNKSQIVVPRVSITHNICNESVVQESYANIEEYSVKSRLEFTEESSVNETTMEDHNETLTTFEDQDECVQLMNSIKDLSSESKDTPTKINVMEEDNSGLKNYDETNPSQSHSTENSDTNLTSTGQYYQTVTLTESEIKHSLQSNNLVKDKHEADSSRAIDHSSENLSIPELSFETSKNKSILKQNKMTFNLCITDKQSEQIDFLKEANLTKDHCNSISKIHNLSGNPDKTYNSESRYCEYNKDSDPLSKTDKENNKLLTSVSKIKKQNVKRVSFKLRNEGKESKTGRNSTLNNTYQEDKSYSRCNQSHILNTSCSLENLVFDGSSSEITSGSVYIDLCASRKSSSVNNNNLEGTGYQEDTADMQSAEVKLQCEVSRESEKGEIEMDEDSLEDSDDDKETDKVSIEDSDDRLEEDERENVEINGEGEKLMECCEENGDNELQQAKPREQVNESTKDSLVVFDESCTINEIIHSLQNIHSEMDEILEDNDSSLVSSAKDKLDKPNNMPVNLNYQFKKPGSCTVLNEKLSTPPTKRKVQEILARIPLSEFKNKKAKPVSVLLTKEQIEQNKIEEMLRKRQKQSTVRTTKTPKLTKPKYMYPKVYDFIIEKLTPSFGLKSRVQAESVVILLNEQADVIMKNQNKLVQTVQEMKIKLANLKIIHTHWDFYKFIMNYFNVPFIRQVYPSGVVSRFEPDNPHQNVCS